MRIYSSYLLLLCIIILAGCSTSTVSSEGPGYKLSSDEQMALGSGLIQHFSGALPDYAYDANIVTEETIMTAMKHVIYSINNYGVVVSNTEISDAIEIIGRVGSGSMNMNPAGLIVKLTTTEGGTNINIRGVAKEGLVKQNTSGKAVERLIADLVNLSGMKVRRTYNTMNR